MCGYVQPSRDFAEAIRVWRFLLTVLGAMAGLFGVTVGLITLFIHLAGLTCLDVPYLSPFSRGKGIHLLRRRLKTEKLRNEELHPENRRKQQ